MRILTRKQFMDTPIGTVFSYYEPICFSGLMIKQSDLLGWETDFLYDNIIGALDSESSEDYYDKCKKMEAGESMLVDFEVTSREGLFEEEQLFAVYEKEDVEKLIKRLILSSLDTPLDKDEIYYLKKAGFTEATEEEISRATEVKGLIINPK